MPPSSPPESGRSQVRRAAPGAGGAAGAEPAEPAAMGPAAMGSAAMGSLPHGTRPSCRAGQCLYARVSVPAGPGKARALSGGVAVGSRWGRGGSRARGAPCAAAAPPEPAAGAVCGATHARDSPPPGRLPVVFRGVARGRRRGGSCLGLNIFSALFCVFGEPALQVCQGKIPCCFLVHSLSAPGAARWYFPGDRERRFMFLPE